MINNFSRETIVYKMYTMVQIAVMNFYTNNLTIVTRKMI